MKDVIAAAIMSGIVLILITVPTRFLNVAEEDQTEMENQVFWLIFFFLCMMYSLVGLVSTFTNFIGGQYD